MVENEIVVLVAYLFRIILVHKNVCSESIYHNSKRVIPDLISVLCCGQNAYALYRIHDAGYTRSNFL